MYFSHHILPLRISVFSEPNIRKYSLTGAFLLLLGRYRIHLPKSSPKYNILFSLAILLYIAYLLIYAASTSSGRISRFVIFRDAKFRSFYAIYITKRFRCLVKTKRISFGFLSIYRKNKIKCNLENWFFLFSRSDVIERHEIRTNYANAFVAIPAVYAWISFLVY